METKAPFRRELRENLVAGCALIAAIIAILGALSNGFGVISRIDAFGVDLKALRQEVEGANARQDKELDDHENRIRFLERGRK